MKFSFYAGIYSGLKQVEACIADALANAAHPTIADISDHLIKSPGKRIRPALCLMMYRIAHPKEAYSEPVIQIAAAIELIHMASLVHDDILDQAPVRHDVPTIHTKWDENTAITIGVYLYAIALKLLTSAGHIEIIDDISTTVKALCEGEMTQVFERENLELSLDMYLTIIYKKTASLFETAARSGARLGGADESTAEAMATYGRSLGYSFQIVDDYMDIAGFESALHKKPGQDFELGELTLPLIYLIDEADDKASVLNALQTADDAALTYIQGALKGSKALERTKTLAEGYLTEAKGIVAQHESPVTNDLVEIVDFVFKRAFG